MGNQCLHQGYVSSQLDCSGVLLHYMSHDEVHSTAEHNNDPQNPILRAIIFSRYFVPTYYICLTLTTAVALLVRSRSRSLDRLSRHAGTWSSASTIRGDESPSAKSRTYNEHTALITGEVEVNDSNSFITRISCNLKALLLYQPRPIPAFSAPLNRLPPNGTSLVTLFLLGLNLFYLLYDNVPSISRAQPFADRAGLCFVANLPILYILGAKNNKPLKWMTGWSYEGLNIIHRRIGEWMVVLACLHAAGMMILWYYRFRPLGHDLAWFISIKIVAIGISAFATIVTICATATGYFRQWCYEVFLATHIILQAAVLALLFFHHHNTRPYCVAAMAIWILDRLVTRFFVSRGSFIATLQIAPDGETVLLFCDIPMVPHKHSGISSGWQAGQHVFIGIPELGWRYRHQLHPFTIASPAPAAYVASGTWPLQLIIRSRRGFSQKLLKFAEYHQHVRVIIDGPYGSTDILEVLQQSDRTCLIAGGTGISVTYPLSWALQAIASTQSILCTRTVYRGGVKHTPRIDRSASSLNQAKHNHLWLRQYHDHAQWITMLPRRDTVFGCVRTFAENETGDAATDLINKVYNTRDASNGRPDIQTEVREWIRSSPKATTLDKKQRVCLIVSGPDDLAREVRNCAAALTREGYNIELFVEKFGW